MKRLFFLMVALIACCQTIEPQLARAQQNVTPGYGPIVIGRNTDYVLRVRTFSSANLVEIQVHAVRNISGIPPAALTFPTPPNPLSTTMVWDHAPFYVGDNGDTPTTVKHFRLPLGQLAPGVYKLYIAHKWNDNTDYRINYELFQSTDPIANPKSDEAPIYSCNDQVAVPNTGAFMIGNWHYMPSFVFIVQ